MTLPHNPTFLPYQNDWHPADAIWSSRYYAQIHLKELTGHCGCVRSNEVSVA